LNQIDSKGALGIIKFLAGSCLSTCIRKYGYVYMIKLEVS